MFEEFLKPESVEEEAREGIIRNVGVVAEHNLPMNLMKHLID